MSNILLDKLGKSNKKLLSNFFFLSIGQGISFLFPLLLTPFLIDIIGVQKFALVMLCQSIMSFFYIFTDFGFNITATQYSSIYKSDKKKLTLLFSEVLLTKIFLLLIGFFILIIIVYVTPKFYTIKELMLFSYFLVVGKVLYPTWFFQGIEEMPKMTLLSIISKLILALLFFFAYYVKNNTHYMCINIIYAIGDITVGIVSIIWIRYYYLKLPIIIIPFKVILDHVRNDYAIFFANFANNVYINSNIIILGFFANNSIVGLYAVAEKVIIAFKQISGVVLQATYPYACKLVFESSDKIKIFLKNQIIFFGLIFLIVGLFIIYFRGIITQLILGYYQKEVSDYLLFLSFVPLIVSLNVPAYQALLIHKKKWGYSTIIILGAILSVLLNLIFTPIFLAKGTIISIIITELFVTFGLHFVIYFKYSKYRFI